MKYIIIFEDGSIWQANELQQDELEAFNDGIIDIIDVKNMKVLKDISDDLEKLTWRIIEYWEVG